MRGVYKQSTFDYLGHASRLTALPLTDTAYPVRPLCARPISDTLISINISSPAGHCPPPSLRHTAPTQHPHFQPYLPKKGKASPAPPSAGERGGSVHSRCILPCNWAVVFWQKLRFFAKKPRFFTLNFRSQIQKTELFRGISPLTYRLSTNRPKASRPSGEALKTPAWQRH